MVLRSLRVAGVALAIGACSGERGAAPDASTVDVTDVVEVAECTGQGARGCTDDGAAVRVCEGGAWRAGDDCAASGRLCEAGACVDPWRYGEPSYGDCTSARSTATRLVDKARAYDAAATRLHLHPELGWMMPVVLREGASVSTATWRDVAQWDSGENDGLFSALYMASQAYRYAVTRDAEALATLRLLMRAEARRMAVTGVPGIFTRQYVPPGIAGIACPTELARYVPSADKSANRWVQVRDDGCVWVVDGSSLRWTATTHCGLAAHAGTCWLDNVSKDEYAGHVFALGLVHRLVDDVELRETSAAMLRDVGRHLVDHGLRFVDWDGRRTRWGQLAALAGDDAPGFNAAMALSFVRTCADASGDVTLARFFDDCLGRAATGAACAVEPRETPRPYVEYLSRSEVYQGPDGCTSNYNDLSMQALSLQGLLDGALSPSLRAAAQRSLDVDLFRAPGQPRALLAQHNPWFDLLWASHKRLGPGSDGPAFAAVRDAICMLREMPDTYERRAVTLASGHAPYCTDRFGRPSSQQPRTAAERCAATYAWWGDPYSLEACDEDPRYVAPPTGFLLPYWMGRYYGLIAPTL